MVHSGIQLTGESGGVGDVWIYSDAPVFKQRFWDIEPVLISLAPGAQLRRVKIDLWRESQSSYLHLELRRESWSRGNRLPPIRVSALSNYGRRREVSQHGPNGPNDTPLRASLEAESLEAGAGFVTLLQMRVGGSELGDLVPGEHQVKTSVEDLATCVPE